MMRRIIIAGCRDFNDYCQAKEYIEFCKAEYRISRQAILLSGHCRGADLLGERYAKENSWEIELYPADWQKYGKAAGPIRNKIMVERCDMLICFWDGKSKGTRSLIRYAEHCGKTVAVKHIEPI